MNLLSRNAYPLDSIKEGADEPVANDTCQIAYESNYTNKSKAHPPGWALHLIQKHYELFLLANKIRFINIFYLKVIFQTN